MAIINIICKKVSFDPFSLSLNLEGLAVVQDMVPVHVLFQGLTAVPVTWLL